MTCPAHVTARPIALERLFWSGWDMFGATQFNQELSRRLAVPVFTAYLPDYFFRWLDTRTDPRPLR
jgi:hypothetical protein